MSESLSPEQRYRIVSGQHPDPFSVLGIHPTETGIMVRVFRPDANAVTLLRQDSGAQLPMEKIDDAGIWELTVEDDTEIFPYRLELAYADGTVRQGDDVYRFTPVLSELDLQLLGEGNHHHAYQKLGAQLMTHEGVDGVCFAVWAPNAAGVSVVGEFNLWDGRRHAMRKRGATGFWELFVPSMEAGTQYKYEIRTPQGQRFLKSDPYAFFSELRPHTASIVWELRAYEWKDDAWMAARPDTNWLREPINIYEVYLPAWRRPADNPEGYLNYRDLAPLLADYVTEMGYTHVELLPLTEFPYDGSWGYQVTGYFAPTSRLGTPDDFRYFVDHLHQRGIGIIMDWVPAHFPKDAHALGRFDGTALYEHADPRQGEHRDWGTYIFNYGRSEVRNFLIASALFWLDAYHIDGLRVDAVASMLYLDYSRNEGDWVPNRFGGRENLEAIEFIKEMNHLTHKYHPGTLTIAEESTAFPMVTRPTHLGGLGFDFKWNMGWMNDTLAYIQRDPVYRKFSHDKLTFGLMYAFSENYILPISHDEVVHLKRSLVGKMPGDHWKQMANLRLYLGFMFTHPGKKLLFQGQDIGQWTEFNENRETDWFVLDWEPHQGAQRWMRDLLHTIRHEPALYEQDDSWEGFEWIDVSDWEQSVISYIRYAKDKRDFVVVVHNFTPVVRQNYRLGVPVGGLYRELLNSDAALYWGSGQGNSGGTLAEEAAYRDFPFTLSLTLPPLGSLIFKPMHVDPTSMSEAEAKAALPAWAENLRQQGKLTAPEETPAHEEGVDETAHQAGDGPPPWVEQLRHATAPALSRALQARVESNALHRSATLPDGAPRWIATLRAATQRQLDGQPSPDVALPWRAALRRATATALSNAER
ncbi:MAG: 1,4-alpha-glucan branching protein GlgB [Anaerolineales bacterium]|nr:1,4-alpha-glucan branching protein GlgB [Anaerolineales bacterium]MCB9127878.1 1,4-alpha-glucan branching protein GlgB [Ardenticatenales bacterium]MCB9171640.1 1,4-alpha-glucan branching protein GlgB [Ardenticatenales bacterium]